MSSVSLLATPVRFASKSSSAICQVVRPAHSPSLARQQLAVLLASPSVRPISGRSSVMIKAGDAPPSFTQVPKAKTDEEAVTGALALAHDCSAAFGQAAGKAKDPELKQALEKFAGQADGWIDQWRGLLSPPPEKETGISTALNAGKVKFARIAGDKAIVKAIYNNTNDSYTAFSEVSKRSDFSSSTTGVAKKLAPEAEAARTFLDKWQAAQS